MSSFYVDIKSSHDGYLIDSRLFDTLQHAQQYCESYNSDRGYSMAVLRVSNTPFQRVAEMNEAFGNAKGDASNIDWAKVKSQCANLFDEYCELLEGLGIPPDYLDDLKYEHECLMSKKDYYFTNKTNTEAVRDALCDIQVFAQGAQHMMGYDGDNDMHDVVDGVMTRFVKNPEDALHTCAMHHAKGVTQVYWEGEYPTRVMKSAIDQPDAPRGKVLKSASYTNTVFRPAPSI